VFICKKEAHLTPLETLAEVYGDAWVWIAFSPIYKVVPAWVVGRSSHYPLEIITTLDDRPALAHPPVPGTLARWRWQGQTAGRLRCWL
jgi:hypothetical protein